MAHGRSRIERISPAVLIAVLGLYACQNPCRELERKMELPGWTTKDGWFTCRAELRTLARISKPFGSVRQWRTETLGQEARLFFGLQEAISKSNPSEPLHGFARWPERVPCSEGVPLTAAEWSRGPLARWIRERPSSLHASFELAVAGTDRPLITLRAWQDLNCDGRLGLLEVVDRLDRTRHTYDQLSYRSPPQLTE